MKRDIEYFGSLLKNSSMKQPPEAESWKKIVLRSMPQPAWLTEDAPQVEVFLSSRVRWARNLVGFRFPHAADAEELRAIQKQVRDAAGSGPMKWEVHRRLTEAEEDYLIGCRLISPDFHHREPGRLVLLNPIRSLSIMVNEEDHFRLQALTAGWSLATAQRLADEAEQGFRERLDWASDARWGALTSSPFNAGIGRRLSVMVHLVGLAQTGRLTAVLQALASRKLTARGLFGEASRAVGAFLQISTLAPGEADFVGACEYLLREEIEARREFGRAALELRVKQATDFAVAQPQLTLADALRAMSWVRWGASSGVAGSTKTPRSVDRWLTTLEVRSSAEPNVAGRQRADSVRHFLDR